MRVYPRKTIFHSLFLYLAKTTDTHASMFLLKTRCEGLSKVIGDDRRDDLSVVKTSDGWFVQAMKHTGDSAWQDSPVFKTFGEAVMAMVDMARAEPTAYVIQEPR